MSIHLADIRSFENRWLPISYHPLTPQKSKHNQKICKNISSKNNWKYAFKLSIHKVIKIITFDVMIKLLDILSIIIRSKRESTLL